MAQPATPHQPSEKRRLLRQQAVAFMRTHRAAALATTDASRRPHVSVVYCIVGRNFNLYFSTRVEGRKYTNLMARPDVALAFYDEQRLQMIQLTGHAQRVTDFKREQQVLGKLLRLRYQEPQWPLPTMQLFHRGETNEIAIIEITPHEMTFANFSSPKTGRYKPVFEKII